MRIYHRDFLDIIQKAIRMRARTGRLLVAMILTQFAKWREIQAVRRSFRFPKLESVLA